MITKNEAAMLPDMLRSVAGLWDELIVADTGSSDSTVALLEDYGATVVHHPWRDDFAAARNASLALATGDWILFLDADERATPAICQQIKILIADQQAGAATLVMRNKLPGGEYREAQLLRLFRNDPAIRFRHKIHEDVLQDVDIFLSRNDLKLRSLSGAVQHLGYVREVAASQDKRARDQGILRAVLQDDPRDFYCWFKLLESARFWGDKKLWQDTAAEVAPLFSSHLSADERQTLQKNPWSGELAALIGSGLQLPSQEALAWLETVAGDINPSPPWHLQRGLWLEDLGRTTEANDAFKVCLADRSSGSNHHHVRALLALSRTAASTKDFANAHELAWQALALAPCDQEAILGILGFSALADSSDSLADSLIHQLQSHPESASVWASQLIASGEIVLAARTLADGSRHQPDLAMGHFVCSLALGEDFELKVELAQAEADAALRQWIHTLWISRQTAAMSQFIDNCGAVREMFPWLNEFMANETQLLKNKKPT